MNNRQFRISGIYFVFLLVLVYLFSTYVKRMDMENLYTYQQFETAVENGEVVSAVISQSLFSHNDFIPPYFRCSVYKSDQRSALPVRHP